MNIDSIISTMDEKDQGRARAIQAFLKHGGPPTMALVKEFLKIHHLTPHMLCPERYPRPQAIVENEDPTFTNMRAVGIVPEDQPVIFPQPKEAIAGVGLNPRQAVYQSQKDGLIYPVNPTREQMEELKNKRMAQQEEIDLASIPF